MARTKQTEAAEKKVPARKAGTTAAAVKAQVPAPVTPVKVEAVAPVVEETPIKTEESQQEASVDNAANEELPLDESAAGEGEEDDDDEVEVDDVVENDTKKVFVLTDEDAAYIAEILKTKIKISDGSESDIFSYGPKEFANKLRPVICHLCRVGNLLVGDRIKRHIAGKTHTKKIAGPAPDAQKFLQPFKIYSYGPKEEQGGERKYFKIFPGENIETITNEHESRVGTKPQWEFKPVDQSLKAALGDDKLTEYNKVRPVLGMEYLIKYKPSRKLKYFCVLCRETIYFSQIFDHVTGALHQATFIIKHYPNTFERITTELEKHAKHAEKEQIIRNIFRKHYRKLELKHGRKDIHLVDARHFEKHRISYMVQIRHKTPHFNETDNPFEEEELKKLISLAIKGRIIMPADTPISSSQQSQKGQKTELGKRKGDDLANSNGGGTLSSLQQKRFDAKLERQVRSLNTMYKAYDRNPKGHPRYNEEWSKFFHRRAAQLRKDNIDPDRYNFSKEWEQFWSRRLRGLYNIELRLLKAKLRQNLLQTQKDSNTVNPKRQKLLNQKIKSPPPPPIGKGRDGPNSRQMQNNSNNSPRQQRQQLNNNDNRQRMNRSDGLRNDGGLRQRSSNNNDSQRQRQLNNNNAPRSRQMNDGGYQQRSSSMMGFNDQRSMMRNNDGSFRNRGNMVNDREQQQRSYDQGPITVISVLRLLTALEDQLGSLGPKSVQLLSRAVLAEKSNQNPNDLLSDNDYYILFATAKEKLKGQIIANVVPSNKRNAVSNAVNDLSVILDDIEENMNRRGSNNQQRGMMGNIGSGLNNNNNSSNNGGYTGFSSSSMGNNNSNNSYGRYNNNNNSNSHHNDNYNNSGSSSYGGGYNNNNSSNLGMNNNSSSNNYRNGNDLDNNYKPTIFGSSSNNQRGSNWIGGGGSGLSYNTSSTNSRLNTSSYSSGGGGFSSGIGGFSQPQSLMSSSGGYDRNNSSNNFGYGGGNNRRY